MSSDPNEEFKATVFFSDGHVEEGKEFFSHYQMVETLVAAGERTYKLKPKDQRQCRFCGKTSGQTSFKKKAHIIPAALGNQHYISDFECDNCNERFSIFEQHLCNFFGMGRSLYNIRGRNGTPDYRSGGVELKKIGGDIKIIRQIEGQGNIFSHDRKELTITIRNQKTKYIPRYVYKAILKIGLCLLREDAADYRLAFKYLSDPALSDSWTSMARMFVQQVNIIYPHPIAYLFKKIHQEEVIPTYVMLFNCMGFYFQIFLPFSRKDVFLYKPEGVELLFCPPFLLAPPGQTFTLLRLGWEDFSGSIEVAEEEALFMKMQEPPNAYYDPTTGEIHSMQW